VTADLVVGQWGARFGGRRLPCAIGRGGIGAKRGEGDGISPRGLWRVESILYRADRIAPPRTALPCRPIGPRDGWSDDPADPAYNAPVHRPHPFGHERLARPDPLYDLVAVLDFNLTPRVPGAGSAIFLHVWRGPRRPTAGCIGLRRQDLLWILERWTPRSRVAIR
jgi:L,D-peptidoglycan transpeptidase YkuD (ErfK/YbiS/YcfS/YnhG family)